jgi:hypothetical protein
MKLKEPLTNLNLSTVEDLMAHQYSTLWLSNKPLLLMFQISMLRDTLQRSLIFLIVLLIAESYLIKSLNNRDYGFPFKKSQERTLEFLFKLSIYKAICPPFRRFDRGSQSQTSSPLAYFVLSCYLSYYLYSGWVVYSFCYLLNPCLLPPPEEYQVQFY